MTDVTPKITLKLCVLGNGGTGKTTLCVRVSMNSFKTEYKMTIGTAFFNYQTQVDDAKVIFQIWDLGGQFQFRTLLESFVKGAKAIILTFSATDIESFASIDEEWSPFIEKYLPEVPVMLISTKNDIPTADVPEDLVKDFMESSNLNIINYVATSSKTGENVQEAFYEIAKYMKDQWEHQKN